MTSANTAPVLRSTLMALISLWRKFWFLGWVETWSNDESWLLPVRSNLAHICDLWNFNLSVRQVVKTKLGAGFLNLFYKINVSAPESPSEMYWKPRVHNFPLLQGFSKKKSKKGFLGFCDGNLSQLTHLSVILNIMFLHRWEDFS